MKYRDFKKTLDKYFDDDEEAVSRFTSCIMASVADSSKPIRITANG